MEVIQEEENSSGARAAMFFLAFSFFLSQLCVNVSLFDPFLPEVRQLWLIFAFPSLRSLETPLLEVSI